MPERIPHDATVSINVGSMTKALRDIALLSRYDLGGVQTRSNLETLADRTEEMYREQEARPSLEEFLADADDHLYYLLGAKQTYEHALSETRRLWALRRDDPEGFKQALRDIGMEIDGDPADEEDDPPTKEPS